jgi:phage terminase small subunit
MKTMPKAQSFTNLTARQQKFVDAFSGDPSEAAASAGYKQPHVVGRQILKHKHVIAALKAKQAKRDLIEAELTGGRSHRY